MGLPFYGRDWQKTEARDLVHAEVQNMIKEKNATVRRDPSKEPYFEYAGNHTVYFQDARSLDAKLDVLVRKHPNVGGIAIWHVGGESRAYWSSIENKLGR